MLSSEVSQREPKQVSALVEGLVRVVHQRHEAMASLEQRFQASQEARLRSSEQINFELGSEHREEAYTALRK